MADREENSNESAGTPSPTPAGKPAGTPPFNPDELSRREKAHHNLGIIYYGIGLAHMAWLQAQDLLPLIEQQLVPLVRHLL